MHTDDTDHDQTAPATGRYRRGWSPWRQTSNDLLDVQGLRGLLMTRLTQPGVLPAEYRAVLWRVLTRWERLRDCERLLQARIEQLITASEGRIPAPLSAELAAIEAQIEAEYAAAPAAEQARFAGARAACDPAATSRAVAALRPPHDLAGAS